MQILSFLEAGKMTIVLEGEIDHPRAKSYIEAILTKLELYAPAECVLDFSDVIFMDSSGIALIINTLRAMTKMEGSLTLTGLRDQPMKILRIAGIDKLVQVEECYNEI